MSLSFWSSTYLASASESSPTCPELPLTALDFLAAALSPNLEFFSWSELGIYRDQAKTAGSGGFSNVEIGEMHESGKLVAVKRSRAFLSTFITADASSFEKNFAQITIELRSLSHHWLMAHPNVLDIFGICLDEYHEAPSLALVLEYSPTGTLKDFLARSNPHLSLGQHVDLISQVSKGLAAVHSLKVAHGDVKTENALVFIERDCCRVKISDFGQSVIAPSYNPAVGVIPPTGTPLLNAPEIRTQRAFFSPLFTIDDAILSDIFSFGLLSWEVLKDGNSFFDFAWLNCDRTEIDLSSMELFLNNLAPNGLCFYGLQFLEKLLTTTPNYSNLYQLMEACLQDDPSQRKPMSRVTEILDQGTDSQSHRRTQVGRLDNFSGDTLSAWTTQQSLYDMLNESATYKKLIHGLPRPISDQVLRELKVLANSEAAPRHIRAHAAMTASELHTISVGDRMFDVGETVHWLHVAATLGSLKAMSWYHRICHATDLPPRAYGEDSHIQSLEKRLSSGSNELYLMNRIHSLNANLLQHMRDVGTSELKFSMIPVSYSCHKTAIFNDWEIDELAPLHLAALLGDDDVVINLLSYAAAEIKSKLGLNAAHYACLGGHISTLKILVDRGVSITEGATHGITPLHLAVFFPPETVDTAARLLIENGAPVYAVTECIQWDAHDIILRGVPLQWAVLTRNMPLLKCLLPHSGASIRLGLGTAIDCFFWEMAEELLAFCKPSTLDGPFPFLRTIKRPFSHWIAHGRDHATAIEKTVQFCHSNNLLVNGRGHEISHLSSHVRDALFEDDLRLIEAMLSVSSAADVKNYGVGIPPLQSALERSKHNISWRKTLQLLCGFYTTEELQAYDWEGRNFLTYAVEHDFLVGARVLLEKGVDINCCPRRDALAGRPLYNWMHGGSEEMLSLLMEHGVDTALQNVRSSVNPLQANPFIALCYHAQNKTAFKIFLDHTLNEGTSAMYLHTLHQLVVFAESGRRSYLDMFRILITHKLAVKHLNDPDGEGCTMLQKSARLLDLDSVRLLLEAGADPCIPFVFDETRLMKSASNLNPDHIRLLLRVGVDPCFPLQCNGCIYRVHPLQICCGKARMSSDTLLHTEDSADKLRLLDRVSQGMETAIELLRSHDARGDDLFQGISELHLAYCVGDKLRVEKLLEDKHDPEIKGHWPSIARDVRPMDLNEFPLEDFIGSLAFPPSQSLQDLEIRALQGNSHAADVRKYICRALKVIEGAST